MRSLKWLFVALGGLAILLGLAVLAITLLVDPNRYRGTIEAQFARATGRELKLEGDIGLDFFPWLSLTTGHAHLANPPGFETSTLASWREAQIGVRLWPLLRGRLEVGRVRFVGLDATFVRRADGSHNWQFGQGGGSSAATGSRPPRIAGLELRDSRLAYVDERTGSRWQLEPLDFTAAPLLDPDDPTKIEAKFVATTNARPEAFDAKLVLRAALGPPVTIEDLELRVRASGGSLSPDGLDGFVRTERLVFDPQSGQFEGLDLTAGLDEARSTIRLDAARLEPIEIAGSLEIEPFGPKSLFEAAGLELPPMRGPRALEQFEGRAGFRFAEAAGLVIDGIAVKLDDTNLRGELSRAPGEDAPIVVRLDADRLDMGRYRRPEDAPGEPFRFPASWLEALPLSGTLDIGEATLDAARARGIQVRFEP